jgi:U3 small nucleolar RNA-associated protein 11
MEHARTRRGVHVAPTAEANKYSQEQLRLMKTQDAGYLNLKAQAEANKAARLRESLHLIGAPAAGRQHVVFVDDDAAAAAFDPAQHFDTPAELLGRAYNRPRRAQLAESAALVGGGGRGAAEGAGGKAERRRAAAYTELLRRQERSEALGGAAQRVGYEKAVMGNGRKRKVAAAGGGAGGGSAAATYRWKNERKK